MFVWISDVLKYKENSDEVIEVYVDQYVICSLQENDVFLKYFVEFQVYKYLKICKKGGKIVCRFGFFLLFLFKIMLFELLDVDVDIYRKKYFVF